jgi:hypothetical protein
MNDKFFFLCLTFCFYISHAQEVVTKDTILLDEIVVIKKQMFNLGYTPVKYTPAERRLYAESSGFFGVINRITGRIRELKSNVEIEKKEFAIQKIENQLDQNYFISLGIQAQYIKGFIFYVVEDKNILEVLKTKDQELLKFHLINSSIKFKECCMK